jgi:prephenate dehydratase
MPLRTQFLRWRHRRCAERYGLKILAQDIQDGMENVTRLAAVGRSMPAATGRDKTSLVIYLQRDRPGALHEILHEFACRGINLTRIESRPSRKALGVYYFYIDLKGTRAFRRQGSIGSGKRRRLW